MAQTTFRIMAPATFPLSPAAAPRRARLRAPIACQYCRGRKVRCDLNKRGSRCTNCELDDVHCKVANTRRRRSTVVPSTISGSINTTTVDVSNTQDRTVSPGHIVHSPADDNLAFETVTLLRPTNGDSEARAPPQLQADSSQEDNSLSPDIIEDLPPETPQIGSLAMVPDLDPMPWKLPAFIKPIDPDTSQSALNYLAAEGAFWLPEGKLRQALVDACFEFVAPYMPSLDRSEILGHIDVSVEHAPEEPYQKTIGILLFQAILFAGSAFVDSDMLQCLHFPSHREVRRSFYRRARLLYDFDVDTSSVEVLHALLLMSFWYEDPDDCKAAAYWIGAHVHHAQQFGVQEKALASQPGQGFYKRLWWSAYIRDALVSMGLRLQPRIRSLVPMLTADDFPQRKSKGDSLTRSALDRATLSIRMAELCVCINQTMSEDESPHQPPPRNHTEMLDLRLEAWHRAYCSDSATPCSRELEYDASRGLTVGRLLMIMTYYTVISTLHLPEISQSLVAPAPGSVRGPKTQKSYNKVQTAVYKVSVLADVVLKKGLISYMSTQGITCVLPAASILLLNLKSPSRRLYDQSAAGLRTCMRFLERLGERYSASEAVLGNLKAAVGKSKISLRPENMTPRTDSESPNVEEQEPSLRRRPVQYQTTSNCPWPHYSGDQAPTDDSGDYSVHMPLFTNDMSEHGEDTMLLDFQKEPLFHQMSNFLELESEFFTQLATSMDSTSREEDSASFIHDLELVG
ncbi:Zn(2)-C6 fungal-type domain-containing protein [Fusarium falciforme]|uniref:Zn(2)-C6 fungal-type domain-containing protein n=1 Tax=Fusarium falciforme TaxID=195108 RepID=UPI0023009FAE|nr:Zn(2)-C6 fungal-type domain-containing protein [Fusarium falciforme]WAO92003.1 Zn(2)-C6 fungal-type domain-containing protein [Fusarium falciforme]